MIYLQAKLSNQYSRGLALSITSHFKGLGYLNSPEMKCDKMSRYLIGKAYVRRSGVTRASEGGGRGVSGVTYPGPQGIIGASRSKIVLYYVKTVACSLNIHVLRTYKIN